MTWAWQPLLPGAAASGAPQTLTAGLCVVEVTTLEVPGPPQPVPPRVVRGLTIIPGIYGSWWPWYRQTYQPEVPLAGAAPTVLTASLAAVDVGTLAPAASGSNTAPITAGASAVNVATLAVASLAGSNSAAVTAGLQGVNVGTLAATLAASATPVVAGLQAVDVATLAGSVAASGTAAVTGGLAGVTVATLAPALTSGAGSLAAGASAVGIATLGATARGSGTAALVAPLAAVTVTTISPTLGVVGTDTGGSSWEVPARPRRRAAPKAKAPTPAPVPLRRRTALAPLASVRVETLGVTVGWGAAALAPAVAGVAVQTLPLEVWQDDVDDVMHMLLLQEVGI